MKIDEVRRVLIIGAGTVGAQIGAQCAMHGYTSVFYDIDPKALDAAMTRIKAYASGFVDGGHLTQKEALDSMSKKYFFIPGFRKAARFLKEYVDKGNLGEKSGKGFYTYPDPAFRRPGFVEGRT